MDLLLLPCLVCLVIVAITAQQYDQNDRDRQNQYDRDRQNNSQFGRPYDNQSQYDPRYGNQSYNGTRDPYNRDQYGRYPDNKDQYNRDQYGRNPNDPYNRDQNNRDQYNRDPNNPYNRDPNNPYNRDSNNSYNRDPNNPYNRDPNNPYNRDPNNQYNRDSNNPYNRDSNNPYNRDQNNRDPNNPYNRDPNDPYNRDSNNRDPNNPYNRDPNSPYNRDSNNRDPYNRDSNNRDPYNRDRDQNDNRDQYGNTQNRFGGNRDDGFGGSSDRDRYGSPQFNTNDNCCRDYCLIEDTQPYVHFGVKTAYQVVFGQHSNQHKIPDCTPVQFWSINRHGTRLPSANTISRLRRLGRLHADILRNYDERRSYPDKGRLCDKDLNLFRSWRWNDTINEQNANMLTQQGIMDMKFLARRYASKFEELLKEPYSDSVYSFQYTDTDRTHDSYQAYIEGLFRNNAFQVHANVFNNDRLIRPSQSCRAWQMQVDENPETLIEYMKFKQSQDYQQTVRDVFRRLGFRYTLNDSIINDMYDMCRYQKAWDLERPSPWCIVFNKDQLKILEYAEDLKSYYKSGYGNEVNRQIGCPPLKDLYEKFDRTVNADGNTGGNKVSVFFTHSVTIQTFLAAMGIAKDHQQLRADNYFQLQNRQWRTSIIDPFAANLAAALYQCRTGERYRVMFFLNEIPVNYPDCSVGLCNWSTVKNKLQRAAENCNLDFCDQNAATALQRNYIIYLISFMTVLFSFRN